MLIQHRNDLVGKSDFMNKIQNMQIVIFRSQRTRLYIYTIITIMANNKLTVCPSIVCADSTTHFSGIVSSNFTLEFLCSKTDIF